MKHPSYLQRFQAMRRELEGHPSIRVTACHFNPPAPGALLDDIARSAPVTPAMRAFYGQANGISIEWEQRHDADPPQGGRVAGAIVLLPVEEVFSDWEDEIWDDQDTRFQALHPLDFFVPEACAALCLDGSPDPSVYYHYCGESMQSMEVNFAGYLELVLLSRGFWYWQRAVARPIEPASVSVEENNFYTFMPRLFPDFDRARFQR